MRERLSEHERAHEMETTGRGGKEERVYRKISEQSIYLYIYIYIYIYIYVLYLYIDRYIYT